MRWPGCLPCVSHFIIGKSWPIFAKPIMGFTQLDITPGSGFVMKFLLLVIRAWEMEATINVWPTIRKNLATVPTPCRAPKKTHIYSITNKCTLPKFLNYILFFFSPTCFGHSYDDSQGVVQQEYKQCTSDYTEKCVRKLSIRVYHQLNTLNSLP